MHALMLTLAVIGSIAAFVGWIMILVAAFRESVGWGLAALLTCGIGALIFVITHWEEGKKGFLINVAGNLICFVAAFGMGAFATKSAFDEFDNFDFTATEETGEGWQSGGEWQEDVAVDDETAGSEAVTGAPGFGDDLDPLDAESDIMATPTPIMLPTARPMTEDEAPVYPPDPRKTWQPTLGMDELEEHLGERLEMVLADGREIRVRLLAVEEDALKIQQSIGAGAMTYRLSKDKITTVKVIE